MSRVVKRRISCNKKAFSTDCENYKLSDFLTFCKKVSKLFTTTVGDHCVAVGGCNKFACVRKITRDIISDCISTKTNQTLRNEPPAKRKRTETRIENTFRSSEGHSAELCMTVKYNKLDEETKKKNIQKLREKKEGIKKVLAFFHQRKIAFDAVNLPCTEVRTTPTNFSATGSTADNENAESVHLSSTINYGGSSNNWWCVSDSLTDVVLQMFFKLFYLPSGGGHLNKTKAAKMVVLRSLNLSKAYVEAKLEQACTKLDACVAEIREIDEIRVADERTEDAMVSDEEDSHMMDN